MFNKENIIGKFLNMLYLNITNFIIKILRVRKNVKCSKLQNKLKKRIKKTRFKNKYI